MRTVELELAVGSRAFRASGDVPGGPVRPRRVLPVLHEMTDQLVGAAIEQSRERGAEISCKSGCTACCHHVIPVAGTEARALHALVIAMSEPRRSEVRARFAAALQRMKDIGIDEEARGMEALAGQASVAFERAYMGASIPCPFLEDDRCSIYSERPAICREYTVTSDPDDCADPTGQHIRPVALPARASRGVFALEVRDGEPVILPLVLALEWAEAHPGSEPAPRRAGHWLEVATTAIERDRGPPR